MRQNRVIKPQDIVILGKLISEKLWPSQKEIAESLNLSQAEISHALKTLDQIGLINLSTKKINKLAVTEFLTHALKYLYPIEKKGSGRGILVGPSSSFFKDKVQSDEYNYIWPNSNGENKGIVVTPLLPELSSTVLSNEIMFQFLNVVEVFRGLGGVRHVQVAQKILKDILK
jgi:biotin operon repressor